ncbi:hypothetical protein PFISCL1PPCAC_24794, partial [Pristionchus fissidentatus]
GSPPGFTPADSEVIEMQKTKVNGKDEPDFKSFPIRASGVRLSHPDLIASRSIPPLHSALFLPPPSKSPVEERQVTKSPKKGIKQIELPQEKAVHFDAREIAKRRERLRKRLERSRK